jgi:hypothetical protein
MRTVTTGLLTEMSQQQYTPYVRINLWDTDPNESIGDILYIPITTKDVDGYAQVELWKHDGATETRLATYNLNPASSVVADFVYWSTTLQKLLIGVTLWTDPQLNSDFAKRILSYTPGSSTLEVFKQPYVVLDEDGDPSWSPISGMLEWGGKLYVTHSGQFRPSYLVRMDPTDPENTYEVVLTLQADCMNYGEGGIAVVGNYLYAVFDERAYRSDTGNIGDWADDGRDLTMPAGVRFDPTTGYAYFGSMSYDALNNRESRIIYGIDNVGTFTDYIEDVNGQYDWGFVGIGTAAGHQPVAVMWMPYNQEDDPTYGPYYGHTDIFRRQGDGTWEMWDRFDFRTILSGPVENPPEGTGGIWPTLAVNQGVVFFQDKLHLLLTYGWWEWDNPEHTSYTTYSMLALVKQVSVGNWVLLKEWNKRDNNDMFHYGGASMCVVGG